jgi:hypothetical protein
VQAFGGAPNVLVFGDGHEIMQLADIQHLRPLGTQMCHIMSWTDLTCHPRLAPTDSIKGARP